MKVGLGSFLDKPACTSPGQWPAAAVQDKAELFLLSHHPLEAGLGQWLVISIYTHQGSHSVNERRDKNPDKYKPFRLRDLRATAG